MNRFRSFVLFLAVVVILLQLWVFLVISEWIVDDSYAVTEFPKAQPALDIPVQIAWHIGKSGGRYALAALAVGSLWWIIHALRRPRERETRA